MSNRVFASIYQLKITIKNSVPSIWRRIQVNGDLTLYQLHMILQETLGWKNAHLYEFSISGSTYGPPDDPEFGQEADFDDKKFKLSDLITQAKAQFIYKYDFGDGWVHEIDVESIEESGVRLRHAVCLDGDRACPPEDIGGMRRYQNLLESTQAELRERYGYKFNPERFNKEKANISLKTVVF